MSHPNGNGGKTQVIYFHTWTTMEKYITSKSSSFKILFKQKYRCVNSNIYIKLKNWLCNIMAPVPNIIIIYYMIVLSVCEQQVKVKVELLLITLYKVW